MLYIYIHNIYIYKIIKININKSYKVRDFKFFGDLVQPEAAFKH